MSPKRGPRGVELLQGESFVLFPAVAYGAGAGVVGTPVVLLGERRRHIITVVLTAAATVAGDTLDLFVDWLAPVGSTWVNGAHLQQMVGSGGAKKYSVVFDRAFPPTAPINVTADCGVGTSRPQLIGPQLRGRYTIVNVGGASFTFSLGGYAI
ncbi:MAG: hypothetical protein NTY23_12445 [Chloroflexi bacterium]|nr:hypothetical protein [Chloroflexota bacterium]